MLNECFKSIIEMDRAAVVICDLNHTIIYMNPAAKARYVKWGGEKLLGSSLLDCHNERSNTIIKKVVAWFLEDENNNMIYTFKNEKDNMDEYMVALRNANNELIGYYEKHEFRNPEAATPYDFSKSLV